MTDTASEPRLYLETPQAFDPDILAQGLRGLLGTAPIACVRLALSGDASEADWTRSVNHLLPVCHEADVPLVITDHFRLVAPLGLDGVHLASTKTPIREVREALGQDRIVGAFAGSSRHDGLILAEAGADYVSFGPVGETGALGGADRAEDDLFAWWADVIETPVVAEGACALADARRLAPFADFVVPDVTLWSAQDGGRADLAAFAEALAIPVDAS